MFQFTRPRGARQGSVNDDPVPEEVSIHAPARGATLAGAQAFVEDEFQFTRPRGARLSWPAAPGTGWTFQFTRPRGARLDAAEAVF